LVPANTGLKKPAGTHARTGEPSLIASEHKMDLETDLPIMGRPRTTKNRRNPLSGALFLKRGMDLAGSVALIVLFSPLYALIAVLVILDDGLPFIHRRRVVGKHGQFDAFKFRTMRRDADEMLKADPALRAEFERNFKLKNDPRITRVGSLLRRFSLDELPQLFNIVAGEMSFVGPRMITAAELERYGPYKEMLLGVRPGLTGYWQINGRQNVSYEERIRMDVHYLENWSLALDLMILLRTPLKVLRREGAY
jgi:lipopolysaccharide/colanic/teichoic acid biosynthesis glycosyltransferase